MQTDTSIDKAKNVLTDCMDILADSCLSDSEIDDLIIDLVNTLSDYPKPQKAQSKAPAPANLLGAYLYTSTARNSLKLALLDYENRLKAIQTANKNIELAYSLLVD